MQFAGSVAVIIVVLFLVMLYGENSQLKSERLSDLNSKVVAAEENNRVLQDTNKKLEIQVAQLETKQPEKLIITQPVYQPIVVNDYPVATVSFLIFIILVMIGVLAVTYYKKRIQRETYKKINYHLAQKYGDYYQYDKQQKEVTYKVVQS